jgi:methylated-DNA-[protein]-cysteine S-methyltransferase
MSMRYAWMEAPVGPVLLARDDEGVRVIAFDEGKRTRRKPREPLAGWREDRPALARELEELEAYFAGTLTRFEMRLAPVGTAFQRAVWEGLVAIPYGETWSYRQLAGHIGRPNAVRAVGAANGANPIAIVIPCHRVIGADGSLTGYGGGLENKERLLVHERRNAQPHGRRPSESGQLGLAFE